MPDNINPVTVLFHSNAPWTGTGYGTQTAQVVTRMKRDGHHVAVNANYGLQGMRTLWEGVPVFPMGVEGYSNDTVRPNFQEWTAEHPGPAIAISLFDAWTMPAKYWDGVPTAIWTMVDHMPVPPAVLATLQRPNIEAIAVTRFGQQQIERAGVPARYIPMAIDTNLYRPGATYNGLTGRQLMGFDEDMFVVSAINANKSSGAGGVHRKAWGENILAFSIFAQDKPDVRLYLHTERYGKHNGLALDLLLKACGLQEGRHFKFVGQQAMHNGIDNEAMAALYNGTDCLLASTLGEGFGLTLLEAQATGTVAVANNFSAQPELMGDGWLTEGQPWWDGAQLSWFNTPNIPSIVDALEAAYARGRERSDKARQHALTYDADLVWDEYWRPYLAEIADVGVEQEPADPVITVRGPETTPHLTIYIPTYNRHEIAELLDSLAPQLTADVEVIVSDDGPDKLGEAPTLALAENAPCRVTYMHNPDRLGGPLNLERGLTAGDGAWLWMISDDDVVLPGALADILQAIEHDDIDRLILLTPSAPTQAAGMVSTPQGLEQIQPGLLIASTLITANVLRRSALDVAKAIKHRATMYGCAWAYTSAQRVKVHASPAFDVGVAHVGEFVAATDPGADIAGIWLDLLQNGYGVAPTNETGSWNYVSAARAASV